MIAQDLLDMLVCPVCKTPVVLNDSGTGLKCGQCRRLYPIQDDIPVMLVDAAKIEGAQLDIECEGLLMTVTNWIAKVGS